MTDAPTTPLSKEQLLAQFDEFFSIHYNFNVNIEQLENGENISFADFNEDMPLPFKMASEITTLDQSALKPLHNVGAVTEQLYQYLQHQNQKIDLLVSFVLNQQDQEHCRFTGTKIGGGGIIFNSKQAFAEGAIIEVKIFLKNEISAIYCHGIVVEAESVEQGYNHKVVFRYIREEDREMLVRASLHLQSKQLKELAAERNQAK